MTYINPLYPSLHGPVQGYGTIFKWQKR